MRPVRRPIRTCTLLVLVCSAIAVIFAAPANAGTVPFPRTDIMFVFDTSGSMDDALEEAQEEMHEAMAQIAKSMPDVQFGLSQVRDYGGTEYDEEEGTLPWRLDVPISADRGAVDAAIDGLAANGGGDLPEAYGRALWEADTNPGVGWRADARHLIVLIADNVPHDEELNEGIPEVDWYIDSPWSTGPELVQTAGVPGTQLTATTDLDWQAVLQKLAGDGKPLEFVDYRGETELLPYWENWAGRTGGEAVFANTGELVVKLVGLARAGSAASACRSVRGGVGKRLLASLKCVGAKTWLETRCAVQLTLGKALKALSTAKGLLKVSKVRKEWRSVARLVNAIKRAKFSKSAPKGFRSGPEVIATLRKVDSAADLVRVLPGLAKAVSRQDFRRIAVAVGEVAGARACVDALLSATA
jgi:von Willebrand factor type A domain